jgi:ATP-dependent Lon protease
LNLPRWHDYCLTFLRNTAGIYRHFVINLQIMGNLKDERFNTAFFGDIINKDADFIPILADGDDEALHSLDVPEILPVLPLRNTVLFQGW